MERTVTLRTTQSGRTPEASDLICRAFSAPMSAPKPASVTTNSQEDRAMVSATTDELPWAMLAKGPQWMNAGFPSSV